jgi:caffeoyl-CoA O-methyltransferase
MKYTPLSPELYDYLTAHGNNDDPILAELAAETAEKLGPVSMMQIAPEQGTLMNLLARSIGARSAIEIGTFTGYSGISVARALPPDGKLLCCDVSEEWTNIARRYFAKAGVADRIELRIAPALETLNSLPADRTFDFAFIDADKVSYKSYYDALLPRMRANGLILFDNVLWMGQVIDASNTTDDTVALRALNDYLAKDKRVQVVMIAVSDGLTIVRKRASSES